MTTHRRHLDGGADGHGRRGAGAVEGRLWVRELIGNANPAWLSGNHLYDDAPTRSIEKTGGGMKFPEALTFDDVLLVPASSNVLRSLRMA